MKVNIDQFYLHPQLGIMKFVGYTPHGLLMFDRYDKWGDQGYEPQNRLTVQTVRTKMRAIPPPQ